MIYQICRDKTSLCFLTQNSLLARRPYAAQVKGHDYFRGGNGVYYASSNNFELLKTKIYKSVKCHACVLIVLIGPSAPAWSVYSDFVRLYSPNA